MAPSPHDTGREAWTPASLPVSSLPLCKAQGWRLSLERFGAQLVSTCCTEDKGSHCGALTQSTPGPGNCRADYVLFWDSLQPSAACAGRLSTYHSEALSCVPWKACRILHRSLSDTSSLMHTCRRPSPCAHLLPCWLLKASARHLSLEPLHRLAPLGTLAQC